MSRFKQAWGEGWPLHYKALAMVTFPTGLVLMGA